MSDKTITLYFEQNNPNNTLAKLIIYLHLLGICHARISEYEITINPDQYENFALIQYELTRNGQYCKVSDFKIATGEYLIIEKDGMHELILVENSSQ